MESKFRVLLMSCAVSLLAQTPPETILTIEASNAVFYREDLADPQRYATSGAPVAAMPMTNFWRNIWLTDIVTVNGKPAKGALVASAVITLLRPAPTGNQGIADVNRNTILDIHIEIQQADGTPVGSLVLSGLGGGDPPLGTTTPAAFGDFAVLGGTGAFLGARGQATNASQAARSASYSENPINRRVHPGGGSWKLVVHLIPMKSPEVMALPPGPAIFHADFAPVTVEKPARAGELLTMSVTGLGPTRPAIDPGQPFPPFREGALHVVNSPVDVTVNGRAAAVVNKIGWPATIDVYRVDFVVPEGTAPGMATVGLSAAWVNGPEVKIPVR